MQLLASGDAIVTRSLATSGRRELAEIRDLMSGSDVAFTNLEIALPDYPAMPAALPKGSHLAGHPSAVDDLKWLGATVANMANNHAVDYSTCGLEAALGTVERAGLPYAGAGRTLTAARAPAFLDTPAGRFALIGLTSSNAETGLAADPGGFTRGRPGVNPLRFSTTFEVTEEQFALVCTLDEQLGTAAARRAGVTTSRSRLLGEAAGRETPNAEGPSLNFAERRFAVGPVPRVSTKPHPRDLEASVRAVAYARAMADIVAVSIHCHEGAADGWNSPHVPDFLTTAAHAWIDAGADVVIGHGPHQLRGVEVYGGKPILYSLGNFVFTNSTVPVLPPEAYERQGLDPSSATVVDYADAAVGGGFPAHDQYWRAMLARLTFGSDGLGVELLPISLGQREARHRRGIPVFPDDAEGRRILEIVAELSDPWGTRLDISAAGGHAIGRVQLTPASQDVKVAVG